MNIGIISLGGESSKKVAESCKKYFEKVDELDLRKFDIRLTDTEKIITYQGKPLETYDCLYIRGSFKYAFLQRAIAQYYAKKSCMPIYSKAFSTGHDKFLTLLQLQEEGVNIPKTYYTPNTKIANQILKNVNYPIIMKLQSGTHGKGVMIAESEKSAKGILDIIEAFQRPYIIQEFVKTENTSDIRVIVAGKKIIASYKRIATKGEFRANIHSGGKREIHKLTKQQEKLAIKSAKCIGANICGVDILNSKDPSVIEINLSPALKSVEDFTQIKVTDEIAKYLFEKTIKFKQKKEEKIKKKLIKKDFKQKLKIRPREDSNLRQHG